LWLRRLECLLGQAGANAGIIANFGRRMSVAVTSTSGVASAPDGASIAYTLHVEGSSSSKARPRVALIHSLALDRSFWDGVVPLLTPHADVLTYDCRGHGKSAKAKITY